MTVNGEVVTELGTKVVRTDEIKFRTVAAQYTEVLNKKAFLPLPPLWPTGTTSWPVSGAGRRNWADRSISQPLEKLIDARGPYRNEGEPTGSCPAKAARGAVRGAHHRGGDVTGAVGLLTRGPHRHAG